MKWKGTRVCRQKLETPPGACIALTFERTGVLSLFRGKPTPFGWLGETHPFWLVGGNPKDKGHVWFPAKGQNPNRTPSEHPNPTTKTGSKMGGEFTYQPKSDPKTVLTGHMKWYQNGTLAAYPLFNLEPYPNRKASLRTPGLDLGQVVGLPGQHRRPLARQISSPKAGIPKARAPSLVPFLFYSPFLGRGRVPRG